MFVVLVDHYWCLLCESLVLVGVLVAGAYWLCLLVLSGVGWPVLVGSSLVVIGRFVIGFIDACC